MPTASARRLAAFPVVVWLVAAAVGRSPIATRAQEPKEGAAAESRPVSVEFRVLTAGGKPVPDIRPADVELKIDGRPAVLTSLEFVQPGRGEAPDAALPPPFAANIPGRALRDTIFVIDDEAFQQNMTQAVKDAAAQFVGRLTPQDRVGLVTIPRGGASLGLTSDRTAIQSALAAISGRGAQSALAEVAGRGGTAGEDVACRTRQVFDALISVFQGAAGGSPATIIIFSGGLMSPMFDEVGSAGRPGRLCEIRAKDYQEVELAMLAAPITVYAVDVPDPTRSGAGLSTNQTAGLEHFAGTTGNRMIRLVGTSDATMAQLAEATSAYYRATFEPEPSQRNGRARPVSLRVSRPDVDVRVRPSVIIPPIGGASAKGKSPAPRDMLRVAGVFRDLPLRTAAYVSRDTSGDKARIVVLVEPVEPGGLLKSAAIGLYDAKGKLVVQATADAESLSRTPPMIATVAGMGTYRLRVAATDADGRAGTVDSALDVKLTGDGPLTLSSLVLGLADAGRFAGRLQFSDEPTAVAYLEIYGTVKGRITADLELAATADGPASIRGAMQIKGEPSDDRHVALGGIPIRDFPPGDINVRVVVSLDGAVVGHASRTLRKVAR